MPFVENSGGGSGSGTVTSVTATDASVVVAGTAVAPTVATADLATIASLHPSAGDITASSQKITNLGTPTLSTDAVTKAYADAAINGLDWKQACRVASAAALAANTYANGASGVGATLTGNAFGALTVDGVAVAANDRVLVKNEASGLKNGIYVVTATGGGAAFYVLTRAADYNVTSEIVAGTGAYVTEGTANVDTAWVMTTTGAITVGTTAITFTQFAAAPTLATVLAAGNSANSTKITSLANGSAAADALAFGQVFAAGAIPIADIADPTTGKVIGSSGGAAAAVLPPGFEIGYDQVTSTVTLASTTEATGTTIISCAAHTFDGSPVMVEFFCAEALTGNANTSGIICLFEGATEIGRLGTYFTSAGAIVFPLVGRLRFTPTAASHTYTVTGFTVGASSPQLRAGAGGTGVDVPMFCRFTKV